MRDDARGGRRAASWLTPYASVPQRGPLSMLESARRPRPRASALDPATMRRARTPAARVLPPSPCELARSLRRRQGQEAATRRRTERERDAAADGPAPGAYG